MKKIILGLIVLSLVLTTGCKLLGPKDEKQAFIDAMIKASCTIFETDKKLDDPILEKEVYKIFKEYGFQVDNQETMLAVSAKYKDDTAVQAAIKVGTAECGKDFFEKLSGQESVTPANEVGSTDETKSVDGTALADETKPADETAPAEVPAESSPANAE